MSAPARLPLVFLIAGEPSGDALGAALMAGLKEKTGGAVRFAGVGGPRMEAEGLESLFPMADLTVMGILEVLPRLPVLLRRMGEAADAVERLDPDAVITIDAPDFCFRVAKKLKARAATRHIPLIHYVAPTVWAWRPGRAAKIAPLFDHLLTLLPFEPPYFERVGLPATFVGHPVVERGAAPGDGIGFRLRHGLGEDAPVLLILPGSRPGEITRLMPVFRDVVGRLAPDLRGLQCVVPTLEGVADLVRAAGADWPAPLHLVTGKDEKADGFAAADVALAASGTVALELALAGVPAVIAYKVNAVSGFIAQKLATVDHVNLVNLVLERRAVPEFIQRGCQPGPIAGALMHLFTDEGARTAQTVSARDAMTALGLGGPRPSLRAAETVLAVMAEKDKDRNKDAGQ